MSDRLGARDIIVLLVLGCGIVSASWVALTQIKRETTNGTRDYLQTVLQTVQEAHHLLISHQLDQVESLASSPEIILLSKALVDLHKDNQLLLNSPALLQLRGILSPVLKKNEDPGFFVIGKDRISVASLRDSNIGTVNLIEEKRPEFIEKAFSGEAVMVPTIESDVPIRSGLNINSKDSPTMFVLAPLRDKDNNVFAVLAIRKDPLQLFSHIARLGSIGKTGESYAFDRRGFLITESRFDHHLLKANLVSPGRRSILNVRIADPGGNLLAGYQPKTAVEDFPLTQMALSATQYKSGYNVQGYRDYRGVLVFGAWTWDKTYNFGLTTEIDIEEALAPYYRTQNTIIMVITITIIICLLMYLFIQRLQREAKRNLVQAYNSLEDRVKDRTYELMVAKDELSSVNKALKKQVMTDSLTGLANRRYFANQLNAEWCRCIRDKKSMSIILFDIDFFKQYNDTYGHVAGDECLTKVAQVLHNSNLAKRPGDIIARYGGEEFIILLNDADESYTMHVANDVRDRIEGSAIKHRTSKVFGVDVVTVSIGYVTQLAQINMLPSALIEIADEALYSAKDSGRNQVCRSEFKKNKENILLPSIMH